jgi:hypothetical protein
MTTPYRLWVSEDKLTLVRLWPDGSCEVATRTHPDHSWGPPTKLAEEQT